MRAAVEYAALQATMRTTRPACAGDGRFVKDPEDLSGQDLAQMRQVCRSCPLYSLCRAYAVAGHPRGGYWAGKHWTAGDKKEK